MIRRHELTDQEWEKLRELLPSSRKGRPRHDDRRILDGIVWKIRTGAAWRDVPERYGPWQTLYTRFRRWALDGTFTRMLQRLQADADARAGIDRLVRSIPRSCGPTARRRRPKGGPHAAADHALGRTRGGPTSKIHLACDWPPAGFRRHGGQHQRLNAPAPGGFEDRP